MNITKIKFVLENCEVININGKDIGWILIDHIDEVIARTAINAIDKMKYCRRFEIEVFSEANKETLYDTTVFQRLTEWNDITLIEITWGDGSVDTFCFEWFGDSEYENKGQNGVISDLGNLYLAMSEKIYKQEESLSDIFPDMNDEEAKNFQKRMISLG